MLKNLIKMLFSILLPIILAIIIMMLGAILVNKTNIGERIVPLFAVISTALSSGVMSYMFSKLYNIKNIYCVVIAVVIFILLKIMLTVMMGHSIVFSINNLIDIAFIILFSFVGALLCSNVKK